MTTTTAPAGAHSETWLRWVEAERARRVEHAHTRLNTLSELNRLMAPEDAADAAGAIWRDYIQHQRADARAEPPDEIEMIEQAAVLVRIARHVTDEDLLAAVGDAWCAGRGVRR
jgi:HEPN domain-containing protein